MAGKYIFKCFGKRLVNISLFEALFSTKNGTGNSECYAVVEGRYTSDQSEVLSIMQSDIGDIRSAQEDAGNYIAEQLKDIHISANE